MAIVFDFYRTHNHKRGGQPVAAGGVRCTCPCGEISGNGPSRARVDDVLALLQSGAAQRLIPQMQS